MTTVFHYRDQTTLTTLKGISFGLTFLPLLFSMILIFVMKWCQRYFHISLKTQTCKKEIFILHSMIFCLIMLDAMVNSFYISTYLLICSKQLPFLPWPVCIHIGMEFSDSEFIFWGNKKFRKEIQVIGIYHSTKIACYLPQTTWILFAYFHTLFSIWDTKHKNL